MMGQARACPRPACCSRSWRRARRPARGCRRRSPPAWPRTCFMSQGARNWPFLTLIARPVSAAARSRSVWRQRKAGIWSTSTTSATGAHCSALVHVGQHRQPGRLLDLGQDLEALAPGRRRARWSRWCGWPCRRSTCRSGACRARRSSRLSSPAIISACSRLRCAQGPAISASGRWLAMSTRADPDGTRLRHHTSRRLLDGRPDEGGEQRVRRQRGATSARGGTARRRTRDGPAARPSRAGARRATCRRTQPRLSSRPR